MLSTPGRISPQDIIDQLSGLSFDEKVKHFREMVREARRTNPGFVAEECVGTNAEVVFQGAGLRNQQQQFIKNVLVISRQGSVHVMTAFGLKLTTPHGTFPRVVDIDLAAGDAVQLL